MDSDSYEVIKSITKTESDIHRALLDSSTNNLPAYINRHNSEKEEFDIKKLNLNSNMLIDKNSIIKMPMSSSSIALVNAKSKALKRIDTMFQDGDDIEHNESIFKSSNSLYHQQKYCDQNIINLESNPSSTNSRSEASQKNMSLNTENLMDDFDNHMENFDDIIKSTNNNQIDNIITHTVDNQKQTDGVGREHVITYSASYKIAMNSIPVSRRDTEIIHLSDEETKTKKISPIKKSKNSKGFALFGRKKFSSGQLYYGEHKQLHRSSTKTKVTPKKINNKIDWSENSKLGIHIWSDHSNPTNDSCYVNEPDNLKFHNINSQGKCLYASKNVPKKKCDVCKIVVHESCVESLQQNVKCRLTYRENLGRKKSFREKDPNSISTISSNTTSNLNAHHWICHKFDENSFQNKCQSCQKSYTNRFGLQTNRTIISCSWCKQAHHMKCFEEKNHLRAEDCSFGEHKQLIVPPSWVVKLSNKSSIRSNYYLKTHTRATTMSSIVNTDNHSQLLSSNVIVKQPSLRHTTKAFIIKSPTIGIGSSPAISKPLLVFINPKSGGKIGPKLLKKFSWLLNPRQVFDLSLKPNFPLHLYRNVPNLRILVGGGDGSVGWVLSVIDQIKFLSSPPSVAVLPLGTGNDMARVLHWGRSYNDEPLTKILTKVMDSKPVKLDRWKVTTSPNTNVKQEPSEKDETAISSFKNDVINNYFSLGTDAHIALDFHEKRETNPQKFTSRWFNMLSYIESWKGDIIKKSWKDLKDYIELVCDGIDYTEMIKVKGYHFILFLNIPKYSGGTNPWGYNTNDAHFQPQSMNDGKIEVIGLYTSHLVKIQIGIGGDRICQAKHIKLTTSTTIPIQIDGEPARLLPSIIEITHKNQATMLEHVKSCNDSPLISYHSNIIKNFEVKYISLNDYRIFRKDAKMLEAKATNVGTICTSNLLDNLSKVRNTINALLANCANGFLCTKWSFLNGEEFYRISDDSDECLLDIVSTDEIVYILDESYLDSEDLEQTHELENGLDISSNSIINNVFASAADISVLKIPTSHTSQQIATKETSSIPSSKSAQFNSKIQTYI